MQVSQITNNMTNIKLKHESNYNKNKYIKNY